MSEIADLKPAPLVEDDELLENLARYADGTLSEAQVKARHHLSNDVWEKLGSDDDLVRAVEAAKLRRIRTGATKGSAPKSRSSTRHQFLAKIMRSPDSNARHVIDSVKALDALATGGAEAAAAGARFEIRIDLGSDTNGNPIVETYSKSIAVDPNEDIDTGVIAAIATKKPPGGGDGGHI